MSEAVTGPSVMMMTSIDSEESLASHTRTHTHTRPRQCSLFQSLKTVVSPDDISCLYKSLEYWLFEYFVSE